jgi:hypothetical protein
MRVIAGGLLGVAQALSLESCLRAGGNQHGIKCHWVRQARPEAQIALTPLLRQWPWHSKGSRGLVLYGKWNGAWRSLVARVLWEH